MDEDLATDAGGAESFEEGRYLYCVVAAEDADGEVLSVEGVDGGEPFLIASGGLAAVVQPCESLYDSDDPTRVKQWLLQHQAVVEAAGERFDTPLPFRFDTVLKGDAERVQAWLDERSPTLTDALDDVAGRWEYRVEVTCSDAEFEDHVSTDDEDLTSLREEAEAATDGTAYMKQRQYERRYESVLAELWSDVIDGLVADLRDHAAAVRTVDSDSSLLTRGDGSEQIDRETTLTLLAGAEQEETIGDRLDQTASMPGVTIRYTGPWPPYTFTPNLGGES